MMDRPFYFLFRDDGINLITPETDQFALVLTFKELILPLGNWPKF
jgi:hypothetical protein